MQESQYFRNYINNLQKEVFVIAYDSNYDILSFIDCYMKGNIRKELDKPYSSWQNQPAERIFEEVISNSNIDKVDAQIINKDAVEWLGFFYSKWHFLTGESSKTIYRFLPVIQGIKNYYTLHQLDEVEAIEICKRRYNLLRNNHRNNECNNKDISIINYDNPIYYSFLGVRMLYKLFRSEIFNTLKYVGNNLEYDFIDEDYNLGIKGDVIFNNENLTILDQYKIINNEATNYYRRSNKSIYFCFLFNARYEEDNDSKNILMDIDKIRSIYPPHKRKFDYLYFYILGKLYEITPSNELYTYYLPFSNRERAGIINKMKEISLI